MSTLSYHLKDLKTRKIIKKVGYGVWEICDENYMLKLQEVRIGAGRRCGQVINPLPEKFKNFSASKEVRGHAFRFSVKLPKIERWLQRKQRFGQLGIEFTTIAGGEVILLKGHKVKVFDGSLDIYFAEGWSSFSNDAKVCYLDAIYELERILVGFENKLNVSIRYQGKFKFRPSRQHYSLIRNELAKDFEERKDKLRILAEDGTTWLLIDNSFQLNELETQHTITAQDDNKVVKDDFNALKYKGLSREYLASAINALIEDRKFYAENNRKHVCVIDKLGESVDENTKSIKELKDTIIGLKKKNI
jgi:hypothetical protein